MIKKTVAYGLCVLVAVSMMPMFAFASEQNLTGESEQPPVATDEQIQPATDGQTQLPTDEKTQPAEEVQVFGATDVVVAADEDLALGQFCDSGSQYVMDNDLYSSNQMRIYVLYIHRASGAWKSSDRYGDAVLVESNGKYLLMDTSTNTPIKDSISVHTSSLVNTLKSIGVRDLDIYISHMHGDHTGGLRDVCNNFNVEHVFLPDIETCQKYKTPDVNKTIDEIYKDKTNEVKNSSSNPDIVYLSPSFRNPRAENATDTFNVGSAICKVIGPVGTYSIAQFASQDGDCGTKEGHYLNNCSLCTIIQCGKFKYITNGDAEKQEEYNLANKYGYGLNSNIMKVSHHGLRTSNTSTFVSKVTPMWSIAQNHGYSSSSTSTSFGTAGRYGYLYGAASRNRNLIIDLQEDEVRLFVDNNNNGKVDEGPITGWVKSGSHYQYYNGSGYVRTGWNWLSGNAYFMSENSGFRLTGSYKINGVKVRFNSSGKLYSHHKPSKVKNRSIKAYSGQKVIIKWRKAYRASRYQVFRSTSKNGTYTYLGNLSRNARSFTDSGLTPNQNYYYKVRAIRYVAGAVLYGPYSSVKYVKAK